MEEFNTKFFNIQAMSAQQRNFNNLKQGSMTVTEAVTKFNWHDFVLIMKNYRFLIEETKEENELSQERHEVEVAGELTSSIIS